MKYYIVEPEVAGEFGDKTIIDHGAVPRTVKRLHYILTNWLGDDLVTSTPCFMVTEHLAMTLAKAQLTGFSLADVTVEKDPDYSDLMPAEMPGWRWLQLHGVAMQDDLALSKDLRLVVSERGLHILQSGALQHAAVTEL